MMHYPRQPASEVQRADGVATHPVRRVGKHLEGLNRIGLEGAVEDQEPSELKTAFDLIPMNRVDLPRMSATLLTRNSLRTLALLTWF
jgi:hypothetical protein